MRTLTGNHVITAKNAAEYTDVSVITGDAFIHADCPALTTVGEDGIISGGCRALISVGAVALKR